MSKPLVITVTIRDTQKHLVSEHPLVADRFEATVTKEGRKSPLYVVTRGWRTRARDAALGGAHVFQDHDGLYYHRNPRTGKVTTVTVVTVWT